MKHRIVLPVFGLIFCQANTVRADASMDKALASIPAEAVAFVAVPNVKQLDTDFQEVVTALGLNMFMPPTAPSPLPMLREYLKMTEGLNESGSVCLAIMPAATPFELMTKQALVVSASDPRKLLEAMGAEAGEGGTWSVTLRGTPSVAATASDRIVIALSPDIAKEVASATGGIGAKLSAGDHDVFGGADLVVWLDGERLSGMFKPQLDSLMAMVTAMQAGGPGSAAAMENNKKQIDRFVNGTQSLTAAISLQGTGVGLRFGLSTRPGTQLAAQMNVPTTTESLLTGLPAGTYMAAFGSILDPEHTRQYVDELDAVFPVAEGDEEFNAEKLGAFKESFKDLAVMAGSFRGTLDAITPGPDGVLAASLLIDTTDSGKFIDLLAKLVATGKEMVTGGEAKPVIDALVHTPDVETLGSAKVHHLKLDMTKIDDIDEDDIEEMSPIIGQEGVMFRFAAVNGKTVALSFGGGSAYMGRLLEQAKSSSSPLDSDAGVMRVAGEIPAKRAGVAYVALDNIVTCIKNGMKAAEEEDEFPVSLPVLNAPIALSSSGEKGCGRFDIFLPMETINAAKNAGMAMMMASPSAAPEEDADAPAEEDLEKDGE